MAKGYGHLQVAPDVLKRISRWMVPVINQQKQDHSDLVAEVDVSSVLQQLCGNTITFDGLRQITPDVLRGGFQDVGIVLPLPYAQLLAEFVCGWRLELPHCTECGLPNLVARGTSLERSFRDGATCPHCSEGTLTLQRLQTTEIFNWVTGDMVPADVRMHQLLTGESILIREEDLESRVLPVISLLLREHDLLTTRFLAFLLKQAGTIGLSADPLACLNAVTNHGGPLARLPRDRLEDLVLRAAGRVRPTSRVRGKQNERVIITSPHARYELQDVLHTGELFKVYRAQDLTHREPVVLKVVRKSVDGDLAENEVRILRHLFEAGKEFPKLLIHFSELKDAFQLEGLNAEAPRRTNVFPLLHDHYDLMEVRREYPKGIDDRTVVWMFKRLLVGAGFAQQLGVIHGGLIPSRILIHPKHHGAKLLGWSAALMAKMGDRVRRIRTGFEAFYPPEILDRRPATATADIYMAAKCMVYVLGGDVRTNHIPAGIPACVTDALHECLATDPTKRPRDAWEFHKAWDRALEAHYGPPSYHRFTMPSKLT